MCLDFRLTQILVYQRDVAVNFVKLYFVGLV
jgi:hypothetical protein